MATSDYTSEIPYGYCHCGCGRKTRIVTQTSKKYNVRKGEYRRYIKGHHMHLPIPLYNMFWSRVAITEDIDLCWEWTGARSSSGYGNLTYYGKYLKANRVAFELFNKCEIPFGLFVLHTCDNPSCCNPKHLFLGTQMDNIKDMISKKRDHFLTGLKLTSKEVLEIRSRYKVGGVSQSALAKEFKVSHSNISFIIHRKTWKDLSDE